MSPAPGVIHAPGRDARAFPLAPMPFDVQQALVASLPADADRLVSLDPYVLLRPDTLAAWQGLLPRVEALFLSEDEMELTEPEALRVLTGGRLKTVVFKRGAEGGTLFDGATDRVVPWEPRAAAIVDPTGAGDVFAAGGPARRARGAAPARAPPR